MSSVPKVSVIIPVYNVEKYLKEAIESAINQTLKEIEIIVVNDGSTDKSLEIIEAYKMFDDRIKLINQSNMGLSEARNSGMKVATGEYVYFLDSDDYIDLNTLKTCYIKAKNENLDVLCFDAESFLDADSLIMNLPKYDRSSTLDSKILPGKNLLKIMLKNKAWKSPVWLFFIKNDFLKNYKFYPKILHEDELFSFILLFDALRTSYINKKFFKRRIRINSIMTSKKREKNIESYLIIIEEFCKIKILLNKEDKKLFEERIKGLLGSIINILDDLNDEILRKKYKNILEKKYREYMSYKYLFKLNYPKLFNSIKKLLN